MLELAILGLLKERAMHGYQLKKRLSETLGSFWQVSYGSLYPTLKRLQADDAVKMIFPKEKLGRRKNVYRITAKGEELFAELLERAGHEATQDNGFSVRFAFFKYVKPETRIRLLERRRGFLEGRGSKLKQSLRDLHESIDSYTLSLMNHELATTETDIRWLDDLIQAEQRQVRTNGGPAEDAPGRPARARAARTRKPRARVARTRRAGVPPSLPTPLAQKERA
jgi:DNA-binding PadR family transcriptional regulator